MKIATGISGEHFDHKVAGIFQDEFTAKRAVDTLSKTTSLQNQQIFVVCPDDRHPGWELEPEDRGIWRTMIQAHFWLGLVGAAVGLIVFFVLFVSGVPFVTTNGVTSAVIAVAFGAVFGMMFGGLMTLRPDHMSYISVSQSALRKGQFVVAVHARSAEQLQEANDAFSKFQVKTVSSL